jgi:hypothetical protein
MKLLGSKPYLGILIAMYSLKKLKNDKAKNIRQETGCPGVY